MVVNMSKFEIVLTQDELDSIFLTLGKVGGSQKTHRQFISIMEKYKKKYMSDDIYNKSKLDYNNYCTGEVSFYEII